MSYDPQWGKELTKLGAMPSRGEKHGEGATPRTDARVFIKRLNDASKDTTVLEYGEHWNLHAEAADCIEQLDRELAYSQGLLGAANNALSHQASLLSAKDRELEAAQEVANRETLSAAYWKDKAQSATPAISGIPLVKMFRAQRDQLADALRHILWIKECGVDGRDEHGVFRNFPETERDAMYSIAKEALKDVPSYVQQLRNVAAGIGMDYDELVRRLSSSAPSDNCKAQEGKDG